MRNKKWTIGFTLLLAVGFTAAFLLTAHAFEVPKPFKDIVGSKSDEQSSEAAPEGQQDQEQPQQPAEEAAQPQEQQKPAAKPVSEKRPEIPVYPGAKAEPSVNKMMKESMKMDAACYRTKDTVQKVSEFYKKQKGLDFTGAEKEVAGFKRCKKEYNEYMKKELSVGCDRDITIQNPWQDMSTGKLNHDTLICIVKTAQ